MFCTGIYVLNCTPYKAYTEHIHHTVHMISADETSYICSIKVLLPYNVVKFVLLMKELAPTLVIRLWSASLQGCKPMCTKCSRYGTAQAQHHTHSHSHNYTWQKSH